DIQLFVDDRGELFTRSNSWDNQWSAWHKYWHINNSNNTSTDWSAKNIVASGKGVFGGNVLIGEDSNWGQLTVSSETDNRVVLNRTDSAYPSLSFIPSNGNSHYHIHHGLENKLHFSQGGSVGATKLLTLTWDKKLGIGTTSPSAALDVMGNLKASGSGDFGNNIRVIKELDGIVAISVINDADDASSRSSIVAGSPSQSISMHAIKANYTAVEGWENSGVIGTDSQLTNGLVLRSSQGKIRFQPQGTTDKATIDWNGDFRTVGAGEFGNSLTVDGHIRVGVLSEGSSSNSLVDSFGMYFKSSGYASDNKLRYQRWKVQGVGRSVWGSGDLVFSSETDGTSFEEIVRFTNTGNVGIGIDSPLEALEVSGNIKTSGSAEFGEDIKVGSHIVWHPGNDGSGSGLDADTIDGLHAEDLFTFRGSGGDANEYINENGYASGRPFTENHPPGSIHGTMIMAGKVASGDIQLFVDD
ncbi:hypothetical protein, partial [Xanthovirga aplysinae]|uniref:hypothetical protein n=1 Tax=Xanthovirga aplysinae TaxID=2529853 RepID=UPI001CA465B2